MGKFKVAATALLILAGHAAHASDASEAELRACIEVSFIDYLATQRGIPHEEMAVFLYHSVSIQRNVDELVDTVIAEDKIRDLSFGETYRRLARTGLSDSFALSLATCIRNFYKAEP